MITYYEGLEAILEKGYFTGDRTGVGTQALPGYYYQINLKNNEDGSIGNFPLLTRKKVFFRGSFEELRWKLLGKTSIIPLIEKNVHIWSEWPFKKWLEDTGKAGSFEYFIDEEKSDYTQEWKDLLKYFEQGLLSGEIDPSYGELGPTYGHHIRKFGETKVADLDESIRDKLIESGSKLDDIVVTGIDQLAEAIWKIIYTPSDRRIIISLWNPQDNPNTLLPPCPCFYQFFANEPGYIHMNVYQRSCDTFLGVPFNDSQDSFWLVLLAKFTNRQVGGFNHFFGDFHIYNNTRKQVEEMLSRESRELPSVEVKMPFTIDDLPSDRKLSVSEIGALFSHLVEELKWEDVKITGYNPHPVIKAPVAV